MFETNWPVVRTLNFNLLEGISRQMRSLSRWKRAGWNLTFDVGYAGCAYIIDGTEGQISFTLRGQLPGSTETGGPSAGPWESPVR